MDVNYTYCGDHLKIHANKEPHCPSQASVIVHVSYTLIQQARERADHLSQFLWDGRSQNSWANFPQIAKLPSAIKKHLFFL